ncbi:regulator of G-protein signaling 2-like [Latimeria chalumnae]|uniref:Regulator of G protein signaling 2 n=1 Tax=Latimeria chalumnae TaxID=7897 RepID=H3AB17_LATCH|nr:PREDICTED: regulator of G-protein signaling 2-like [Latimeria chalumnae]|eukprot:XP_006010527.1 PREDICTED: regulator of G-protein signaling 2-like [Latimeria chalumnae]
MQSAMFFALKHKSSHTMESTSHSFQEGKTAKMKRNAFKEWKTRLNYFLENSSLSTDHGINMKAKAHVSAKPSPKEAKMWSESLDSLLAHKYGRLAFRAFLKAEFSDENIEFWMACEDFKNTKTSHKLLSKATKIYNEFIETDSPKEVNLDFNTKEAITHSLQKPSLTCFNAAQKRVYSLMANNSYPRFLQSEFYTELCKT